MTDLAFIKPYALIPAGRMFFRTIFNDSCEPENTYWIKLAATPKFAVNMFTGEQREFNDTDIVCEINDIKKIF